MPTFLLNIEDHLSLNIEDDLPLIDFKPTSTFPCRNLWKITSRGYLRFQGRLALYLQYKPAGYLTISTHMGQKPQLSGWLYHGPRLLFQPVIVWWCLYAAEVIDWRSKRQT